METFAGNVGTMSGRFEFAEGWSRHAHWGYASDDFDPLTDALPESCMTDSDYEKSLREL